MDLNKEISIASEINIQEVFEKAKKINFNFYDMLIMLVLANQDKAISVSELQRLTIISYKNLLPHLKKLSKLELIEIVDFGKGKKKEIILSKNEKAKAMTYALLYLFEIEDLIIKQHEKPKTK